MRTVLALLLILVPALALASPDPWRVGATTQTWAGDPDVRVVYYEADCATGERLGDEVPLDGPFVANALREIPDAAYVGSGSTVCIAAYAVRISTGVRSLAVSAPQTFPLAPPTLQVGP